MTGIIIKRYRPEEFPRHLDFLERMTVTKGTVEDWHALKSLHYKTDGKPFAPTYYRCELDRPAGGRRGYGLPETAAGASPSHVS